MVSKDKKKRLAKRQSYQSQKSKLANDPDKHERLKEMERERKRELYEENRSSICAAKNARRAASKRYQRGKTKSEGHFQCVSSASLLTKAVVSGLQFFTSPGLKKRKCGKKGRAFSKKVAVNATVSENDPKRSTTAATDMSSNCHANQQNEGKAKSRCSVGKKSCTLDKHMKCSKFKGCYHTAVPRSLFFLWKRRHAPFRKTSKKKELGQKAVKIADGVNNVSNSVSTRKRKSEVDVSKPPPAKRGRTEANALGSVVWKKRRSKVNASKSSSRRKRKRHPSKMFSEVIEEIKKNYALIPKNILSDIRLKRKVFKLLQSEPKLVQKIAQLDRGSASPAALAAKRLVKWALLARKRLVRKEYSILSEKELKTNVFKLEWSEPQLVERVACFCEEAAASATLEAKRLVKWCLLARKRHIQSFRKVSETLKAKCSTYYALATQCSGADQLAEVFLGISRHTVATESYFLEPSYNSISALPSPLKINKDGIIMNGFPTLYRNSRDVLNWQCGPLCKTTTKASVKAIHNVLKTANRFRSEKHTVAFIRGLNDCKHICFQTCKLGHSLACRLDNGNGAPSVVLQNLAPHYPQVRSILRLVLKLEKSLRQIDAIDVALYTPSLSDLKALAQEAQLCGGAFQVGNANFGSEDALVDMYRASFTEYTKRMSDLPTEYCFSCERLCFRRDLTELDRMRKIPTGRVWKELLQYAKERRLSVTFVCSFCLLKARGDTLPSIASLNKMDVPETPSFISDLNNVEKLLTQRVNSYQVITKLGFVSGGNRPWSHLIPKGVGKTFHLPLPLEETLKKILRPEQAIMFRPEYYILVNGLPTKQNIIWQSLVNVTNMYKSLQWYKINNPLYSKIQLPSAPKDLLNPHPHEDDNILFTRESESSQQIDDPSEIENPHGERDSEESPDPQEDEEEDFQAAEDPEVLLERIPNAVAQAMLTQRDRQDEFYEQYTIHPVYEKRINKEATTLYQKRKVEAAPLDSRADKLDLMCFPDLYPYGTNGLNEKRQVLLQLTEYVKARLLSRHSKFRLNIQYLFFLLNQVNMKQLAAGIYQVLNVSNQKINVDQYLQKLADGQLEGNLTNIFGRLRNTESYWKIPRSKIQCMIDNYGPPTFFLTLSPADYDDKELGEYLRKVNGDKAAGKSLSALIAADPVSVSRYLDQKFKAMLDFITVPDGGPLGVVKHFVWRREYQGRGTQHFHLLIWIEGAPVFGEAPSDEVAEFIVSKISCAIPDKLTFPELHRKVMKYQDHRHNSYCQRSKKTKNSGTKKVCRFSFPRTVTDKLILRDVPTSISGRRNLRNNSRLYDLPRKPTESRINDYNAPILAAWIGNMDIQYVGENSAVIAKYISKYQTKSEKSHMVDIFNDINSTKSLQSRLWNIAFRGISNRECGALEAADTLLGIPLFGTDDKTVIRWLDNRRSRNRRVKNLHIVRELDGNEEDFYCPSFVDTHYPNRPEELEDLCLYEFAQMYDVIKNEPMKQDTVYYPYEGFGYFRERKTNPYLINYIHFDPKQKPEEYCFSLLLLFKPWRSVEQDLLGTHNSPIEAFDASKESLKGVIGKHRTVEELHAAEAAMTKKINEKMQEDLNRSQDSPAETSDHQEALDHQVRAVEEAMGEYQDQVAMQQEQPEDLATLESQLNKDQLRVYRRAQEALRAGKPWYHFVSGVGGTGKSFLIKVITLWVRQVLGREVAITAPTGIAAHNINGMTIHRLLQLPIEHGKDVKYTRLSDKVLQVLRSQLKNVVLLILDEVSMVSNVMLQFINLRLSEIFDTFDEENGWFGRIHILLFGDLLQLPPVNENSPFISMKQAEAEKYFPTVANVNLWQKLFSYDELTINMRQKSDKEFSELLANIRLGFCSKENLKTLQSRLLKFDSDEPHERLRQLSEFILNSSEEIVCLFPTRKMCDQLNKSILSMLQGDEIILAAEDTVDVKLSARRKKAVDKKLKTLEEDCTRTAGLEKTIVVKLGARVMLKRNIDVSKGYVNGATGTVVGVTRDTNNVPTTLHIQMKNDILDLTPATAPFEISQGIFIHRKQFPVTLAYAITIHKSQGLSLKNCAVDIGNTVFSRGQSYVALSRVLRLEGLHIINLDPSNIMAQTESIKEYNRLRLKFASHLKPLSTARREKNSKVKDRVWTSHETFEAEEEVEVPKTIQLPDFENESRVSCYANASLQCLLSYEPLNEHLRNSDENNALKLLAHQYFHRIMTPLSARNVRAYAGELFCVTEQQDAQEFLGALINRNEILLQTASFSQKHLTRCNNCPYENSMTENSIILEVPALSNENNILRIIDNVFSESLLPDSTCEQCRIGKYFRRTVVQNTNNLLILQLLLWSTVDGQINKNTDFKLNKLPTTIIRIADHRYKLHAAVFHHGIGPHSGHYTAVVRKDRKFFRADDTNVSECRWPNASKEAYLLFYIRND